MRRSAGFLSTQKQRVRAPPHGKQRTECPLDTGGVRVRQCATTSDRLQALCLPNALQFGFSQALGQRIPQRSHEGLTESELVREALEN